LISQRLRDNGTIQQIGRRFGEIVVGSFSALTAITQELPGWLTAVIAFTSVAVTDVIWVLYIRWSAKGEGIKAGAISAALVVIGWSSLVVLLGSPWVAIPSEMLGAFVGTMVAIRLDRGKK
jgi:hypothetical protein